MKTIASQTPDDLKPPRGRQVSNQRHGLRGAALPRGCGHIRKSVDTFRRAIEAALLDQYGEIDLYRASLVNSAYRHERTAALCERWIRTEQDALDPSQRLAYLKQINDATDRRDKCLERLGLDKSTEHDEFAGLTLPEWTQDAASEPPEPDRVQTASSEQEATDATLGPLSESELAQEILEATP
jgi:hypothetical protein